MPATALARWPAPGWPRCSFAADFGFKSVYLIVVAIFIGIALAPALVGFKDRLGQTGSEQSEAVSLSGFRDPTIRLAAAMTGLSFAGEVLIAEWVAIYLRDERGFSGSTGALAVTFYGVALMVGRLVNGPFVNRLGLKPSFQLQGVLTIIGGVLIITSGPPIVALVGAFIAGFGLAGVGPSGLSLAGKAWPNAPGAAAGSDAPGRLSGTRRRPPARGVVRIGRLDPAHACMRVCRRSRHSAGIVRGAE